MAINYEEQYRNRFNIPPPPTPNTGVAGPQAAPPPPAPAPTPQRPPTPQAPPQAPAPAPGEMDFNTWFNQGNQAAGGAWAGSQNSAETKAEYQQYLNTARGMGGQTQGSGLVDNADYSGQGDSTGMRAWARQNGMSEDFMRIPEAKLASWQSQRDTNCPPKTPYQAFDGSGCVEKPIDSNRGGGAGGAGGAGGGRGGGGFGDFNFGGGKGFAGDPALAEMTDYWKQLTKQSGSRYTPEAMAALEADAFSRARAQEKLQLEQAQGDMAQRGVSRSANQNAAVRQIGVGTGQQIMQNRAQIQRAKIEADFQDKQAAIQNAQNWVNSMRDYLLRGDANAIQREQIAASIRLAQMNIAAQKQQLQQQYQNQLGLMDQSYRDDLSRGFIMGGGGF